ncbi:MAG: hypothetical protein ACN4GZ_10560 [Acidimicrobiales bacterium]
MAACRGCDTEGVGNFCAECGLPLGDTSLESLDVASDAPTLMGASGPELRQGSERLRAGSRRRTLALSVALLGFLGAGTYAALRSPAPEAVPEVAVDEVGDEQDPGEPQDSETVTTSGDSDGEQTDTTSVTSGDSWIEGDSQWFVIVSAQGNLHRIDTRTGVAVDLEAPGYPVARLGDEVLLVSEGRLVITDDAALLADPPVELPQPMDVNVAVGGPFWLTRGLEDDRFWLQRYDSALEIDLSTGTLRREVRSQDPYVGPFPSFSPDFRTPLSGGVYRLDSDPDTTSYKRVMDGRILAQSNGAILVTSCGLELVCENVWFDQLTMEPRDDLATPEFEENAWFVGGTLADGRYVGTNYGTFMDVRSGAILTLNEPKMNSMFSGELQISPDGSVVAYLSRSRLNVHAATSPKVKTAELQGLRSNTRPLFIPATESG